MQDYIAMVIIWYATQTPAESGNLKQEELLDSLAKMELLIENAL